MKKLVTKNAKINFQKCSFSLKKALKTPSQELKINKKLSNF